VVHFLFLMDQRHFLCHQFLDAWRPELYLATKLYSNRKIDLEDISKDWQELAQDIEPIGPATSATWKTWRATQVISENDNQTRLYNLKGYWRPLGHPVVRASSCYLRSEQDSRGTAFTILSVEEEALHSVRALIENFYAPVEPASLDDFLAQNGALPIQAARTYDSTTGTQSIYTYGHLIDLKDLLAQGLSLDQEAPKRILSLSANVGDTPLPLGDTPLPLKVRLVYVSNMAHEVGFSIESSSEEDYALVDKLFILADKAFRGDVLIHTGP